MTDDDVRERFSAYHDRELPAAEHEAVRAALEANPSLKKEYDGFCKMLGGLGGLAEPAPASPSAEPEVDLLKGVQHRLHKRSAGRYYRDRWSRTAGTFPLEVIAALVLVVMVLMYWAMTSISVRPVEPAPSTHGQAHVGGGAAVGA